MKYLKFTFKEILVIVLIALVATAGYVYFNLPSNSVVYLPGDLIEADELVDVSEDVNMYGVSAYSILIEDRMDFVKYWLYDKKIHLKYIYVKLNKEENLVEQRKDGLIESLTAEKDARLAIIDYVFDHYSEEDAVEVLGDFSWEHDYYGDSATLFMITTLIGIFEKKPWVNSDKKIVITGGFGEEGNVMTVGGVNLKALTAKENDADIFIVPKEQVDEAFHWVSKRSDLQVVGVETFDELITWLDENVE